MYDDKTGALQEMQNNVQIGDYDVNNASTINVLAEKIKKEKIENNNWQIFNK